MAEINKADDCIARVAYRQGISKRAFLNPAASLHLLRGIISYFLKMEV
jgi:hypothetical protein